MSILFDGCHTGLATETTVYPGSSENHSEKISGTKHDSGKLRLSRVPPQIITAIANVRDYGDRKYTDPENWRKIAPERWHEALLRHTLEIWTDPLHIDEESGLPSIWHLACNAAFLCACLEEKLGERMLLEREKEEE